MVLRYRLHGTQNELENETCHNSEISKMLSPEKEHFKMDTLRQMDFLKQWFGLPPICLTFSQRVIIISKLQIRIKF